MFKNLGETFEPTYKEKLWMYDPRTEVGKKRMERQKTLLGKFLPIKRGKALDIGCGMGISTFALEDLGFKVIGIDLQEELVEKTKKIAEELGYKAEFRVMDARKLDFPNENFDLVVLLGNPLPHLSIYDFDKIVQEAFRVLKPNGTLFLEYADWVRLLQQGYRDVLVEDPFISFHVSLDTTKGQVERLFINLEKGYFFRVKINVWAPWIVEFILRKAGFEVETHYLGTFSVVTVGVKNEVLATEGDGK
ncbi:MAG: methyltransferase [Thermococcaceae archaeon]|jgi:SAM-dependent methyltransferase|uniref:class I SAM-dependent methyltransferase n=1 Tax=Thermococcus sp. 101 C5 TaxID=2654197 RepID=UPI0007466CD7|nr:class I SAM-dependent methyltransferase [Thermococcus sp. 101 C5]KUK00168.1 MAG: UbiE/COQ5 methyltransferase [Thermococcales archaeon 44_46]MDK2782676.1 methyltransferase [Thermococcaceae archaeon]MDK2983279.1 methyltransferase [Thermococcaceae archaeon]MDN5321307.1 methyltransferase [Thermococcaceae archaeon]MPW39819.1 methyltransferase domain-containing protein [Thermococcus sp. 101 C5]